MRSELGRSIAVHRGTFSAGGIRWYLGAVCLVGGRAAVGKDVLTGGLAGGQGLLGGIAVLLVGPLILAIPLWRWKQSLEIFEGGFVWTRLTGVVTVMRDEIQSVEHITHESRQGSYVELLISLTNGKSRSIVGIEQPEQAASLLSSHVPVTTSAQASAWQPPVSRSNAPRAGWTPPGGAS